MLKKTMLLASMVLAVAAFAAPAATATPKWTNAVEGEIEGEITSERGGFVIGPGDVDLQATLEGSGGQITGGETTGVVPTNIPGCQATVTFNIFPWTVKLTTPDTIDITVVRFTIHSTETPSHKPGCFGIIPSTISVSGTMRMTVENGAGEVCFNLNPYIDDLFIEGTGETPPPFDLTGVLCIEGTEVE